MTDTPETSSADRFTIVFEKLSEADSDSTTLGYLLPAQFAELQEIDELRRIVADIRQPPPQFYTGT